MADEWCSFQELVNIVRRRLNASIGRSEAIVIAALASGEVRKPKPKPAIIGPDDGLVDFDMRPGTYTGQIQIRPYSKEDFLDWLDRHHPEITEVTEVAEATPVARAQSKRLRAQQAVEALWPKELPGSETLPNKSLCQLVNKWLMDDCKKHGIPPLDIGNDTILRAAGRK
jgi:hypothetical protein